MVIGAGLRLWHIDTRELEYDEGASAYFAALDWSDLWGAHARLETNPPLFYTLAKILNACGATAEQLRYISAAASVASIAAAWSVANALSGRFAAIFAAWLIAASAQSIMLAQYGRAYALLTLCLLLAWRCLLGALRTPGHRAHVAWWAGYVTAGTAALFTHYCALPALLALNAAMLFLPDLPGRSRSRFVATGAAANLAMAACYAPWLPVLLYQTQARGAHAAASLPYSRLCRDLRNIVFDAYATQGRRWFDPCVIPPMLCCVRGLRLASAGSHCLALAFLGPLVLMLASQIHPLLNGKTLSWAYAFMLVCAGVGCSSLGRLRAAALASLIAVQLTAALSFENRDAEGWTQVVSLLRANARAGDVLYVSSAASILLLRHYFYPETRLHVVSIASAQEEPWFHGAPVLTFAPLDSLPKQIAECPRIWLLIRNQPSIPASLAAAMGRTAVHWLQFRTVSLLLVLYTRR